MKGLSVCLLLSRFEAGGLERVQMHIASGLRSQGVATSVVTRRVDDQARSLLRPDVPLHSLGGGRLVFIYRLFAWLRKAKPRVVLTSANDIGCFALLLRGLFWRDSRVVWVQHLSISGPLHTSTGWRRLRLLFEIWLMRRLVRHADAVVAVSCSVADDMRRMIDPDLPVQVIYNPVIADDFQPKSSLKVEWPWLDHSVPTVVFVGRLAPVKRLDLLLKAFSLCVQTIPARLLVVGDGPEAVMAEKLARVLSLGEACQFAGHRENPLPWIRQADLLVLCSDAEGFGLVLVEAMACGVQVVSTDCPDGPAEVLGGGRYGRLVPVGDVEALAAAMEASLRVPYVSVDELRARAADFGVEQSVRQYAQLLNTWARR